MSAGGADGRRWRRHAAAARRCSYGELIGGKNFASSSIPSKPVTEKDAEGLQGRRQVGRRASTFPTRSRAASPTCRTSGARHAARPRGASARDRRQARKLDESSVKDIPGIVKVVREGNFLGVVAHNEWAAIKGAHAAQGHLVEMEGLAGAGKLWEHVAQQQGRQATKRPARSATPPTAMAPTARRSSRRPTTSPSTPTARSARPARWPNSRTASSTSWSASQATHNLRKQLAQMFGMAPENVRCIYVEGSGCYGRNGHEDAAADAALLAKAVGKPVRVQWSRADEHGWDPKGPPTLIDLRARWTPRATSWPGKSDFFIPQQTAGGFLVPLVAADARRHAGDDRHRAGQRLPEFRRSLQVREHQDGLPPAGDDAVPAILDQDAGPHAEHLCERVLHGRTCGGGRSRPARIPPESISTDKRGLELLERLAALANGTAGPPRRNAAQRQCRKGRGMSLCEIRAGAHLCRRRRRGRGEPHDRRDPCPEVLRRSRLRPDHQSRRAQEPDRGQRHPDGEPDAARGS